MKVSTTPSPSQVIKNKSCSEQFHNTPETQTDESYNHPEDVEHFAHHESIERVEAEKEAKYQGVPVEEVLEAQRAAEARRAAAKAEAAQRDSQQQQEPAQNSPVDSGSAPKSKIVRGSPSEIRDTPPLRQKVGLKAQQEEWGQGDAGYKPPKNPIDRMRFVHFCLTLISTRFPTDSFTS